MLNHIKKQQGSLWYRRRTCRLFRAFESIRAEMSRRTNRWINDCNCVFC
jgi:hypothetical protein